LEEKIEISKVRYKGELLTLAVLLGFAGLLFLLAVFSVFGLIWLGLFIFFQMLFHQFTMAYFRANSVKLGPNQYSGLYAMAESYAERLGLKKVPDIYIIQETTLNAFATKTARRHVVVLYSHTVETMLENERADALGMVLGHELGHIAAKHLRWAPIVSSAGLFLPIVYRKWSRCCEYTADRLAYLCLEEKSGALEGLIKLTVGKKLATETNLEALAEQHAALRKDRWAKIVELWSTHPHLLNRIHKLNQFTEPRQAKLQMANIQTALVEEDAICG